MLFTSKDYFIQNYSYLFIFMLDFCYKKGYYTHIDV